MDMSKSIPVISQEILKKTEIKETKETKENILKAMGTVEKNLLTYRQNGTPFHFIHRKNGNFALVSEGLAKFGLEILGEVPAFKFGTKDQFNMSFLLSLMDEVAWNIKKNGKKFTKVIDNHGLLSVELNTVVAPAFYTDPNNKRTCALLGITDPNTSSAFFLPSGEKTNLVTVKLLNIDEFSVVKWFGAHGARAFLEEKFKREGSYHVSFTMPYRSESLKATERTAIEGFVHAVPRANQPEVYREEEIETFHALAAKGIAHAECELGKCYEEGNGVDKNLKKAIDFYCSAAKKGNALGQYRYGFWCLRLRENIEDGIRYLEKAGEQELPQAYVALGEYYEKIGQCLYSSQTKQCYQKVVKWYEKAANQNHVKAQVYLGLCYEYGKGVEKNEKKAAEFYQLAANQGHVQAQTALGCFYQSGVGVAFDEKKAVALYQLAADQGYARAQYNLGLCYQLGVGIVKDEKKAAELFQLSYNLGNANAQFNLGWRYEINVDVEKNERQAVEIYQISAKQGSAFGQNVLGMCYEKGIGIVKNEMEAVRLYELAAKQNYADAQCNLGWCYERGMGVIKNESKAVRLYQLAAGQGHKAAQTQLLKFHKDDSNKTSKPN